jgi:hypothetical protein
VAELLLRRVHFMVGLDLDVPRSEVVVGVFE